jgi:hypothetical protein
VWSGQGEFRVSILSSSASHLYEGSRIQCVNLQDILSTGIADSEHATTFTVIVLIDISFPTQKKPRS